MQSIEQISAGLTRSLGGLGINITGARSEDDNKKVICFNNADGTRICEEIPISSNQAINEVKCNIEGLCSVFISNIEHSNKIEPIADKLGIRTFSNINKGIVTKTLTGIVKKKDIKKIGKALGTKLDITESEDLRSVKTGDITPPKICNINPLASDCEPYMMEREWYYMGPFVGWVRANGLIEAFKIARKGSKLSKKSVNANSIKSSNSNKNRVLTTL